MPYNEEDKNLHLITPALQAAGRTGPRITMEYAITAGQIVLQGDRHRQLPSRKADYLLRYAESLPIAVVEAKDESHTPGASLQQAKGYAELLGLLFTYSSNGRGWEEWDFTTNIQHSFTMDELPASEALWQHPCNYRALSAQRTGNALPALYWRDPAGKNAVCRCSEVAANRPLRACSRGHGTALVELR